MRRERWLSMLSVFCFLILKSFLYGAPPVIMEFSSEGGHTRNKDDPSDLMYLVRPGDEITFRVKAKSAEHYQWQVNKAVQKNAEGPSLRWTVPNEKGIWEVHLKTSNGDGQAHHEWVVATLSPEEAPDFVDYFTDKKWAGERMPDPWGRPVKGWILDRGFNDPPITNDCAVSAPSSTTGYKPKQQRPSISTWLYGRGPRLKTGTWKLWWRFPAKWHVPSGSYNQLQFRIPPAGSGSYNPGSDSHHYFVGHNDCGPVPIPTKWYHTVIIVTPDGFVHTYLNDVLLFRGKQKPREADTLELVLGDGISADGVEVYKERYLFPSQSVRFTEYIDNWKWSGGKHKPVKKKGIVIRGRQVTLSDVGELLNDPNLFKYDKDTRTADCYADLIVDDGMELVLKDETLRMHCKRPGALALGVKFGSVLKVENSTITTSNDNYYVWRLASTTHYGFPVGLLPSLTRPFGTQALNYTQMGTIEIINSTIDNCGYLFLDMPYELRLVGSKFTRLHEVDTGEYSSWPTAANRKIYVKGKKSFWVYMGKGYTVGDFKIEDCVFKGATPTDLVFFFDDNKIKANLYNLQAEEENFVVRKGLRMQNFWYPTTRDATYPSTLGLVNCKFGKLTVYSDKAWVVPKYYLDVKVIDVRGQPVRGAEVAVWNEVDDWNYPPECIIHKRTHWMWKDRMQGRAPYYSGTVRQLHLYERLRKTTTGKDGHIPLPNDRKNTMTLADFVQDKDVKREFTYKVTVEAAGMKKIIAGVNPGPEWYRPDPNKPTYTITAVLDGKTESEADLKRKGLAGPTKGR